MRHEFILVLMLFVSPLVQAEGWEFGDKIPVAPVSSSSVHQHLDATGRNSMAISGNVLAVAWEDNRDGSPQAYVSFKNSDSHEFFPAQRISSGLSAYAPTIVTLRDSYFLVSWEQDGAIWIRWASPSALGPSIKLSRSNATQSALATQDGRHVIVAWCQSAGKFNQIVTQKLKIDDSFDVVRIGTPKPVDSKAPKDEQSYPVVAVTQKGTMIAWEDRRNQHTILLYSRAVSDGNFSEPRVLNEVIKKSERYGGGNGVARVALAVYGDNRIAAAWMDKRGDHTGYDIYAAFSDDGGWRFGANELVQDDFADQYAQWHPAIAGDASGRLVAAWDDDRDDASSIWLAWKTGGRWSTNISPTVASGPGDKTSPSLILDAQGNLHLIWLERSESGGPGRIMYAVGRAAVEVSTPPQQTK